MKSFLTHLNQIICMDYHEKTLTKSQARFFAQVVTPDYLLVIFLILNALIDVSEDPQSWEDAFGLICISLASLTCYSTDFYGFFFNLAAILEICKLDSEDAIFQLANICFWIQHTKIPLIGISKPFLHKMPVPS